MSGEPLPLTSRERSIIIFIAKGYPNKLTAAILKLSVKSIINHRANIYAKLKVHCTAELIKVAVKQKIITMEEL